MTAITINIPNHEVSFFKKMIAKMGWTYAVAGACGGDGRSRFCNLIQ